MKITELSAEEGIRKVCIYYWRRLWSRWLSRNGSIFFGHVALYATVTDGRFVVLRVSTTNVTVFRCETV